MATPRWLLRRRVGGEFGEAIILEATADSADPSLFEDVVNLQIPDTELAGREAWYFSSAHAETAVNVGKRRVVVANAEDPGTITVAPPWPASPKAGDVVELYNARGYSATIPEIHDKFNQLIDEVSDEAAWPETTDWSEFSLMSPYITAPEDWVWLFGVEYDAAWLSSGFTSPTTIYPADITVRPWNGASPATIQVKNNASRQAHLHGVRLIGAPPLTPLENDDDETTVDAAWLVDQAVAELRRSVALRWGDAATSLALSNIDLVEAEKRRVRVPTTFPAVGRRWRLKP